MTFIEYYKTHSHGWYRMEELPEDVRADLWERLKNYDKQIGCMVYHSHLGIPIEFKGMKVGYYVRSKNPFSWRFRKGW